MQSIKSALLPIKDLKKSSVFENKYSDIKNFLDLFNISNDLYYFLCNPFLNYKKGFLIYIIFHLEYFSSIIIKFTTSKKSCIIYASAFIRLWSKKKRWVQLNVITAVPLSSSVEEYILSFFKKSYKNLKFFLEKKVKNSIIGGLILRFEDKEWDRSLEESIRKLRIHLKNAIAIYQHS